MLTAIETATSLYLYQALPSPTTAQPARHGILLVAPADMPCTNTTYVAAAISKAVSAANQSISSEFRYQSTPADLVVAQLIRMESWDADWDGNGAARPLDFSLKATAPLYVPSRRRALFRRRRSTPMDMQFCSSTARTCMLNWNF